jgi:hypothetical protein
MGRNTDQHQAARHNLTKAGLSMFMRICKRLSTTNNTHQLFTRFTALPVVTPALVKNEFCGVVTLVNVGVTAVTTWSPGTP